MGGLKPLTYLYGQDHSFLTLRLVAMHQINECSLKFLHATMFVKYRLNKKL